MVGRSERRGTPRRRRRRRRPRCRCDRAATTATSFREARIGRALPLPSHRGSEPPFTDSNGSREDYLLKLFALDGVRSLAPPAGACHALVNKAEPQGCDCRVLPFSVCSIDDICCFSIPTGWHDSSRGNWLAHRWCSAGFPSLYPELTNWRLSVSPRDTPLSGLRRSRSAAQRTAKRDAGFRFVPEQTGGAVRPQATLKKKLQKKAAIKRNRERKRNLPPL